MSAEKPDPKNPTGPRIKTTKLPDQEAEIPDEELEKATGGAAPSPHVSVVACTALCNPFGDNK